MTRNDESNIYTKAISGLLELNFSVVRIDNDLSGVTMDDVIGDWQQMPRRFFQEFWIFPPAVLNIEGEQTKEAVINQAASGKPASGKASLACPPGVGRP